MNQPGFPLNAFEALGIDGAKPALLTSGSQSLQSS
jgi:hypothetical protein